VFVLLMYALVVGWIPLGRTIGQCLTDEAADPQVRRGALAASSAFFARVLRQEVVDAYAMLSPSLRGAMAQEKFQNIVTQITDSGGGTFAGLKAEHVYQVERTGQAGRAICGNSAVWVAVNAVPDTPQAHVLYTAKTPAHDWALTAWMVKPDDAWQIASFYITISGIAGRSPEALEKLAKAQTAKGHAFNAYMLMASASATAYRGPDLQLSLKPRIDAVLENMKVPAELAGKPPRSWRMGGRTYSVEQVTIVGAGDALGLVVMHRDPTWDGSDAEGEVRNRVLLTDFIHAHPEYQEAFGFLVARLLRPGENLGWGTVYDAKTGFAQTTPPPSQ
jgi:hypothetical protein